MGHEPAIACCGCSACLLALIAVGLLVLVVQRAASHPADADWLKLTTGDGRTAQGAAIEMRFDRPAHPVAFDDAACSARCANGSSWTARLVGLRRHRRSLPPRWSRRCGWSRSPTSTLRRRRLRADRVLDARDPRPRSQAGARMGADDRGLLPRRRREHGMRLGPRAVRDRRAARADACYQCTPFMRLAIATCSIEAFSLGSFSPLRRGRVGEDLVGHVQDLVDGLRAPARRPPRRTSPGAC